MRFLVLLKNTMLIIVECREADIFEVAKRRDAGICAMFMTRAQAETFILNAHGPQAKSGNWPSFP
jgi:hypothetical protein